MKRLGLPFLLLPLLGCNALRPTVAPRAATIEWFAARDIAFARKTTTIEGMLSRYWYWGERGQLILKDPEENMYWACYPGRRLIDPRCPNQENDDGLASEMILRRREKQTLDALERENE